MSTQTQTRSAADKAAHREATHYRLPVRTPGAVQRQVETDNAYAERANQLKVDVLIERAQAGAL